jgi:hypothetical protein
MRDLNTAESTALGVIFIEAHAINKAGEIIVMGKSLEELPLDHTTEHHSEGPCAPAPPATFLLVPSGH